METIESLELTTYPMRHSSIIALGILLLVTGLIYFQSLTNEFVALDDELLIIDNPKVHGLTFENITSAFTSYDPELYIPITYLLYQIEYTLFELNPVGYHTVSLLLHLLNIALVLAIFKRFFVERVALVCAFLFAVHPLNVEAVSWASGQKDLLAACFALLSFLTYLRAKESGKSFGVSIAFFCLALASKISVVFLPLTFLVTDWARGDSLNRQSLTKKFPYFIVMVVFLAIAFFGKQTQMGSILTPILLAFVSIPFYLQKFLIPTDLAILYPFTDPVTLTNPRILLGIALIALITLCLWLFRRKKLVILGACFFLMMLALSFLNVMKGGEAGVADVYFASDRYVYLSSIGLLLLLGSFLTKKSAQYLIPIILIFGFLTYRQSLVWRNSTTLFQHVIESNNESHVAYTNLAGFIVQNGDLEQASELYQKSLDIRVTSRALYNLGRISVVQKQHEEAIKYFEQSLEIKPNDAEIHTKLGGLYLMQGNVQSAFEHLTISNELNPRVASVHYNLGLIYEHLGKTEEAKREFETVLEIDPEDVQAQEKLSQR